MPGRRSANLAYGTGHFLKSYIWKKAANIFFKNDTLFFQKTTCHMWQNLAEINFF